MTDDKIILSREIIEEVKRRIALEFPYFSYPLEVLKPELYDGDDIRLNKNSIQVGYDYILKITADGGVKCVEGSVFHALLHAILLHPLTANAYEDISVYDFATDIIADYICDIKKIDLPLSVSSVRNSAYNQIKQEYGDINIKNACEYARANGDKYGYFKVCEHQSWHGENEDGTPKFELPIDVSVWQDIISGIIPKIGNEEKDLKKILSITYGTGRDYKSFLRQFIKRSETVKSNDEEFDYIYYCLGLSLYKNVPLIENLESGYYKEFTDIAIAIDTSGSTRGEAVKTFLEETFELVTECSSESEKYRLLIIQCDQKVQRTDYVTDKAEFTELMQKFTLQGGGGTDFRPVFDYLTVEKNKGRRIKGLIYYTDGVGIFPKENPPFKTCFALLGEGAEQIKVPYYAYKIIL